MPSTYLSLHYHIVFSTKNRASTFRAEWLPEIHRYLGGTVKSLGGIAESVGGVADHVHALVGLKATHCLADFMREWKKSTSAWIKTQFNLPEFAWQEGYSAFTISATARERVVAYIANQEDHHRVKTFREELIELLNQAGVDYDSKYLD